MFELAEVFVEEGMEGIFIEEFFANKGSVVITEALCNRPG